MKNLRKWIKTNHLFILLSAAVVLTAWISLFFEDFGKNPLEKEEVLENPVKLYTAQDRFFCISDASETVYLLDQNYNIEDKWISGEEETSFSNVKELAWNDAGEVFLHDRILTKNGSFSKKERILLYSPDGKKREVLYEIPALRTDGKQYQALDSLKVVDDALYFTQRTNKEISICKMTKEKTEVVRTISYMQAYDRIQRAVLDSNLRLAIALKSGDVCYEEKEGSFSRIYDARANDAEEYCSLISDLAFDEEDMLYLCDVGLRKIYAIDLLGEKEPKTVVERNQSSVFQSDVFSEMPLYTGIEANQGLLSFLSAEYRYDAELDEEIYVYRLVTVTEDGRLLSDRESVGISGKKRVEIAVCYLSIFLLAGIFLYGARAAAAFFRKNPLGKSSVIQLIMLVTAVTVALCVSAAIFDNCNSRYVKECGVNLVNVSHRVGENLSSDTLHQIHSPDFYGTKEYQDMDTEIKRILQDANNIGSNLYCVVYKIHNDVVYEAYRDDEAHACMYPMAGRYKDSIEEQIAADNTFDVAYDFALSEGTYIYALVPVYDEAGENCAFVEVGMDYGDFSSETKALYQNVLIMSAMAVIILMLLFSESLSGIQAIRINRRARKKKLQCPPELIRPLSFLFFFIANLSTAFLPIYGTKLWREDFPLQVEMAAALPLSVELIMAAAAAFLCGLLIQKTGIRQMCMIGGGFYVAGGLLSAFAGNLWALICANAMCGIGSGVLSIVFNTWAASYEEEEKQNRGFIQINAAYLSGLNCGAVIGSLLWENIGIKNTFLVSVAGGGLLILLAFFLIQNISIVSEEKDEDENGSGSLRDLWNASVVRYFLFISMPYLICMAFLEYFFPIEAERNGLSAIQISMAFLISGMISIYIGTSLAEPITEKMGTKKAMIFASFLYVTALFYLVVNPSIWSCYIVVAVFAVADSFGLSAQSVYFSSLPAVKKAGQSKAFGVNDTVESMTSACGSLIFGAALLLGTQKGILLIAVVFTVCLLAFLAFEKKQNGQEGEA